jgi:hypothetical protein
VSGGVLLSFHDAEAYSGLSERYLRTLVFERRIAYHKDKRRVFFRREDLDAFINSLRVEPRREEREEVVPIRKRRKAQ